MGESVSERVRTFAGRYTIDRQIGRGSTAVVYLARDCVLGRNVAIKVFRQEFSAAVGPDRFLREIRLTQSLHHPHILEVLDSGAEDGALYFVAPYMDGGTLRSRLHRETQLTIPEAVSITIAISEALDHAHTHNVIHRDVKPENILFSRGRAYLADFGIARVVERAVDATTTSAGIIRGTPAYMSPEQASGSADCDGRSDLYSLGLVLYEMLAGMPAYIGPSPQAVIRQRFAYPPREIRAYRHTIPAALEAVVSKAVALSPADRYATGSEFAEALRCAPIAPETDAGRQRSTRLRWLLAASVAGVAAAANIGTGLGRLTWWGPEGAQLDTSAIALMPVESDDSIDGRRAFDIVHEALNTWNGVRIVDRSTTLDVAREFAHPSDADMRRIARQLGAGRYVRIRLARTGSQWLVTGALYDTQKRSRLAEATVTASDYEVGFESTIGRVVDSLLLRGVDPRMVGSRRE